MIYAERRKYDYEFLIDLAQAALGGKSDDGTLSVDNGEGLEDMTEEQEEALRRALGEDFDTVIGK